MMPDELLSLAGLRYGEFQSAANLRENSRDRIIDDFIDLVDMVPDLLALTERQQEALVEVTAEKLYPFNMPTWKHLPDEDFGKMMFSGLSETFHGKNFYRAQAREELSIQKRPRFTAEEKVVLRGCLRAVDWIRPWEDEDRVAMEHTKVVLSKMLEE